MLQVVYAVALSLLATMYAYECFITVFISAHHSVVSTRGVDPVLKVGGTGDQFIYTYMHVFVCMYI